MAAQRRQYEARRCAAADWITAHTLYAVVNGVLDAIAKAWLIEMTPGIDRVRWSQIYAQQHVPLLAETAPITIADPLVEALQRNWVLSQNATENLGRIPRGWHEEAAEILRLAQESLDRVGEALEAKVDLHPSRWIALPPHGVGRIGSRIGTRMFIDFGRRGVAVVSLFDPSLRLASPPDTIAPPVSPQHARWLWFAGNPDACGGREVCPCCGLPGLAADQPVSEPCRHCGWIHDGGNYDPERPNLVYGGLDLARGRRRFEALGYAATHPKRPLMFRATWFGQLQFARRLNLVSAMDDLIRTEASGEEWTPVLAALSDAARTPVMEDKQDDER